MTGGKSRPLSPAGKAGFAGWSCPQEKCHLRRMWSNRNIPDGKKYRLLPPCHRVASCTRDSAAGTWSQGLARDVHIRVSPSVGTTYEVLRTIKDSPHR